MAGDGRRTPNAATTAIPTPRKEEADAATEKLNTREAEEPKRRGGGVSARRISCGAEGAAFGPLAGCNAVAGISANFSPWRAPVRDVGG